MPEVISDIIVAPATVYYAPLASSLPADTVAAGTAWGGAWVKVGYTSEPLSVQYEADEVDIEIEQSLTAIRRVKTKENLTLETVLAEFYLDALQLGMGGVVSDTPAGASQPGMEELALGGLATITARMWGFEGAYIDEDAATFPIRFFIYSGTAKINGKLSFAKGEMTGTPLQIMALADMTKSVGSRLVLIQKMLEAATS